MNGSGDNYLYELIEQEYFTKLQAQIAQIIKENPSRKYAPDMWTDTYWDGSFGPMWKAEFWKHPWISKVNDLIARENRRIGSDLLFNHCCPYQGPDLCDIENV